MIPYKNLSGNSGVQAYEVGPDFIKVMFATGKTYVYTYARPGATFVQQMIARAKEGRGLSTYISQTSEVRKGYERIE